MQENFNEVKEVIYEIAYTFCFVSVLLVLKQLLSGVESLTELLIKLISFEILSVVAGIIAALGAESFSYVGTIFSFISGIIYLVFLFRILSKKNEDKEEVVGLKPFAIASLLIGLSGIVIGLFMFIAAEPDLGYITSESIGSNFLIVIVLLNIIPYFFLIKYFKNYKVEEDSTDFES